MRKSLWMMPVVFLFAAITPSALRANDITYAVNQTVGAGSVTGTIETDGATNILSWNLTLNDGTETVLLDTADSTVTAGGGGAGIEFSPAALTFNYPYDEENGAFLEFVDPGAGTLYYGAYDPFDGTNTITINDVDGDGVTVYSLEPSTLVTIATAIATPEPGTGPITLAGLGMIAVLMWKRRRDALRQPQAT
jgi:hypothetical protein